MNKIVLLSISLSCALHYAIVANINILPTIVKVEEMSDSKIMQIEIVIENIKKENSRLSPDSTSKTISKVVPSKKESSTNYLSLVRSKINKVKYKNPLAARLNLTGEVQIGFNLNYPKSVSNIMVLKSSGEELLDESALETIERFKVSQLNSLPKMQPVQEQLNIKLKIVYN